MTDERHPKAVYVKEASILPALDDWLAGLFTDEHIDSTCASLAASLGPDPEHEAQEFAVRRKIKECDTKLAQYRKTLEAGGDPSVISRWIDEVQLERKASELQLRRQRGDNRMTGEEIRSLVEQLRGIVSILQNADPEDRRAVYQELNVSIDYHTDGRLHVKAGPGACTNKCVGGATQTLSTRDPWEGWLAAA
jgi:hypothetical protein